MSEKIHTKTHLSEFEFNIYRVRAPEILFFLSFPPLLYSLIRYSHALRNTFRKLCQRVRRMFSYSLKRIIIRVSRVLRTAYNSRQELSLAVSTYGNRKKKKNNATYVFILYFMSPRRQTTGISGIRNVCRVSVKSGRKINKFELTLKHLYSPVKSIFIILRIVDVFHCASCTVSAKKKNMIISHNIICATGNGQ